MEMIVAENGRVQKARQCWLFCSARSRFKPEPFPDGCFGAFFFRRNFSEFCFECHFALSLVRHRIAGTASYNAQKARLSLLILTTWCHSFNKASLNRYVRFS